MKKIYYAHPVTHYGTVQESDDIKTLEAMGFEVVNPNQAGIEAAYKLHGFGVFLAMIDNCDALAYRPFMDGSIGAGVAKEIDYAALDKDLPVFELKPVFNRRLTVEQTRERIKRGER